MNSWLNSKTHYMQSNTRERHQVPSAAHIGCNLLPTIPNIVQSSPNSMTREIGHAYIIARLAERRSTQPKSILRKKKDSSN
uniref:Uncharacterized protein n=1 Tax=Rhizophora mucronata TaxID=61149 RepID=A0A2P2N9P1_RHIMU